MTDKTTALFDVKAPLSQQPGPSGREMERDYQAFNAATVVDAAQMWVRLLEADGDMFVTLAGAMSTAQLGITLAPLIRERKVCGIGCTGANLEEDLFNLVGFRSYQYIPDYGNLSPAEEKAIEDKGLVRVTDALFPEEEAMKPITDALLAEWQKAEAAGERLFPYQFLYRVIRSGALEGKMQALPENSWMLAAAAVDLPIFTPGWEDSTTGNFYEAQITLGKLKARSETYGGVVRDGTEWFGEMGRWYERAQRQSTGIGYFQIGGGIAGDGPICVVPYLLRDLGKKVKRWAYFCQITDAHESYGGYSGARPREKITWSKLDADTPMFDIHSDATIVAPRIFRYVLGQ